MSDIAIKVEDLSKLYKINALKMRHDTLRDQIAHGLTGLFTRNGRAATFSAQPSNGNSQAPDSFWALKDVSFEVKQGEIIGIIGRNGAGKSTMLKILSRITQPTKGQIDIFGRIGSLLEVGTGFHPELSGRQNIYLNGAILGMTKAEISRKFDEIVAFAEIEKFMDSPVKRYSSGMYVRLAFAVAAHLEPEILLLDEVLAVGDVAFQRKCLGKVEEVAGKGRTIVFVSHNMAAVTRLCKRCVWLDQGKLRDYADTNDVVSSYLTAGAKDCGEVTFPDQVEEALGSEDIRLLAVRVRNNDGRVSSSLDIRLPFTIELKYRMLRNVSGLRVGLELSAADGTVVFNSKDVDYDEAWFEREKGTFVARCAIPGDFLNHGHYYVSVGCDVPMVRSHFSLESAISFQIEHTGGIGTHLPDGRGGLLRLKLPWSVEKVGRPSDA